MPFVVIVDRPDAPENSTREEVVMEYLLAIYGDEKAQEEMQSGDYLTMKR